VVSQPQAGNRFWTRNSHSGNTSISRSNISEGLLCIVEVVQRCRRYPYTRRSRDAVRLPVWLSCFLYYLRSATGPFLPCRAKAQKQANGHVPQQHRMNTRPTLSTAKRLEPYSLKEVLKIKWSTMNLTKQLGVNSTQTVHHYVHHSRDHSRLREPVGVVNQKCGVTRVRYRQCTFQNSCLTHALILYAACSLWQLEA
jgi:hypothetical protein